MTTKTILKNINIRNKRSARSFVNVLEKAKSGENKEIKLDKEFRNVKQNEIKHLFQDIKS